MLCDCVFVIPARSPALYSTTTLLLGCALTATSAAAESSSFASYAHSYNKSYATAEEANAREQVYLANMRKAAHLAASNPLATFGENRFADLTAEEFSMYLGIGLPSQRSPAKDLFAKSDLTVGAAVDWRQRGAVTPVKNQGNCGDSSYFEVTGSIEGQWAIAGNGLVSLSEQELISCDPVDYGCNGALASTIFAWIVQNRSGWVNTEASYPYASAAGLSPACVTTGINGAKITGYASLPQDEAQLGQWMLTNGPIALVVDATSFQTYSGGIVTNCFSQEVNHGILAVGFDDTNVPPYWILKNSWGTTWGESGYIRIQKGTNQCLITTDPCTSTV